MFTKFLSVLAGFLICLSASSQDKRFGTVVENGIKEVHEYSMVKGNEVLAAIYFLNEKGLVTKEIHYMPSDSSRVNPDISYVNTYEYDDSNRVSAHRSHSQFFDLDWKYSYPSPGVIHSELKNGDSITHYKSLIKVKGKKTFTYNFRNDTLISSTRSIDKGSKTIVKEKAKGMGLKRGKRIITHKNSQVVKVEAKSLRAKGKNRKYNIRNYYDADGLLSETILNYPKKGNALNRSLYRHIKR